MASDNNSTLNGTMTSPEDDVTRWPYIVLSLMVVLGLMTNIQMIIRARGMPNVFAVKRRLVISMGVADCNRILMVVTLSVYISCKGRFPLLGDIYCHLWLLMDAITYSLPIAHLCLLVYDQTSAAISPMRYAIHRRDTRRHCLRLSIVLTISTLVAILPMLLTASTLIDESYARWHGCIPLVFGYGISLALGGYLIPAAAFLTTVVVSLVAFILSSRRLVREDVQPHDNEMQATSEVKEAKEEEDANLSNLPDVCPAADLETVHLECNTKETDIDEEEGKDDIIIQPGDDAYPKESLPPPPPSPPHSNQDPIEEEPNIQSERKLKRSGSKDSLSDLPVPAKLYEKIVEEDETELTSQEEESEIDDSSSTSSTTSSPSSSSSSSTSSSCNKETIELTDKEKQESLRSGGSRLKWRTAAASGLRNLLKTKSFAQVEKDDESLSSEGESEENIVKRMESILEYNEISVTEEIEVIASQPDDQQKDEMETGEDEEMLSKGNNNKAYEPDVVGAIEQIAGDKTTKVTRFRGILRQASVSSMIRSSSGEENTTQNKIVTFSEEKSTQSPNDPSQKIDDTVLGGNEVVVTNTFEKICQHNPAGNGNAASILLYLSKTDHSDTPRNIGARLKRHKQEMLITSLIFVVYSICTLPYLVALIRAPSDWTILWIEELRWLSLSAPIITPIVMLLLSKDLKKGINLKV